MQDATVQSIPQTSQVPAAVAPSSYVAAAPAPQLRWRLRRLRCLAGGYELPPNQPLRVNPPVTNQPRLSTSPNPNQRRKPGSGGESMGIGVQQGGEPAESASPIPVPGSTVNDDPGSSSYPGQLGTGGAISPGISQSDRLTWSPNQVSSPNSSQTSSNLYIRSGAGAHAVSGQRVADYYNLSQETVR
jgi:hypothetical protein